MRRIAVYCRVSTDKDDQANSLENQKKYFQDYIEKNEGMYLVKLYVDEGISGTTTNKRHAFGQMISDAYKGKFDMIMTKEVSRFARDTVTTLEYTRKLKEINIGILFLNDNIYTLDNDGELRLTIMASIAQEESRKTSERVKWGQKRRMEQGIVFGTSLLGYDVKSGKITINEEGARIVRLIFYKFVTEGKGTYIIARELTEAGILTLKGHRNWSNISVLRILKNEKYCGDLIQRKTYTPDYLTHKKKKNTSKEKLIVIKDHHEPIVSRVLFEKAQKEIRRRSAGKERKQKYTSRYCFSGKIKCGICGSTYVARTKKKKDGTSYHVWRCAKAVKYGKTHPDGCSNISVSNEMFMRVMQEILKNISPCTYIISDKINKRLKELSASDAIDQNQKTAEKKLHAYQLKKQQLIDLYLNGEISRYDFSSLKADYETQIKHLQYQSQISSRVNTTTAISNIERYIYALCRGEKECSIFYRNILDDLTIYSEENIELSLKYIPGVWKAAIVSD